MLFDQRGTVEPYLTEIEVWMIVSYNTPLGWHGMQVATPISQLRQHQSYFVLWLNIFHVHPFFSPTSPSASEDTYCRGIRFKLPGRGRYVLGFIANAGQTYVLTASQSFKRCVRSCTT